MTPATRGREPGPAPAWTRLPWLLPAMAAMVLGTSAGLWRLGAWPGTGTSAWLTHAAATHGGLMVCGFFGALIGLERAVALQAASRSAPAWQRVLPWLTPLAAGAGSLLALTGAPTAAHWAWLLASLALLATTLAIWRRQPEAFMAVLVLGAAAWAAGQVQALVGQGLGSVVAGWIAFLVLTVAGERLELSRLAPRSRRAGAAFGLLVAGLLLALLAIVAGAEWGSNVMGATLLALAGWLWRHDLARRTLRQRGLPRFVAVSLLAGYLWLAVSGALMAQGGLVPGGPAWDATLHALLLGFVFSMVFGHAPLVLPAVLRIHLPWGSRFYAPLALLHAAVALRVGGGLSGAAWLRQAGAWLAALALAAFVATVLLSVSRARTSAPRARSQGQA